MQSAVANQFDCILKVEKLTKHFVVKRSPISKKNLVKAVDEVSFEVYRGEAFGLIGESGSGKTTLGNLILRLLSEKSGSIAFDGVELTTISGREMRKLRKDLQVVFQYTSETLDPKMTIEELLREPLKLFHIVSNEQLDGEVDRLLELVGLSASEKFKFPHQLSGGQRQRIGIARAISTRPKLVVCDEPISALDVSIQGQILNLMNELKKELGLTYLFISHDLKAVRHLCDRIAVMQNGKLVEVGTCIEIMEQPKHEYTQLLIRSQLRKFHISSKRANCATNSM